MRENAIQPGGAPALTTWEIKCSHSTKASPLVGRVAHGCCDPGCYHAATTCRPWVSKESVNCRLDARFADNDVLIPIVARADDTAFHSVVVEPILQDRPNSWTLAAFRKLRRDGTQIRVRGQLVLDNAHRVHGSPDDAGVSKEPKRLTDWEIHPVKHVFVCKKASNNCDSTTAAEWRESS